MNFLRKYDEINGLANSYNEDNDTIDKTFDHK